MATASPKQGPKQARLQASRGPYRILVVNDYSPEETHGISVHLHNLIIRLRQRGHTVHHFTTRNTPNAADTHVMTSLTNPYNKDNKMSLFPGFKFLKMLMTQRWDLVHIVYPTHLSWWVLPLTTLRGVPTYCSHHVDLGFLNEAYNECAGCCAPFFRTFLMQIGRCWLYCPTALMATAQAGPTYTAMEKEKPCWNRGYIDRIPTSIDNKLFFKADPVSRLQDRRNLCELAGVSVGDLLILQVGRLAPEKGQEQVLKGLEILIRESDPKTAKRWQVILVGDGPSRARLEAIAKDKNLPVKFLGSMPNHVIPGLYRGSDCFITCTKSESFGITVLEAIACGCPVVMPRLDTFEELYASHLKECMYEPGNIPSMASAIRAAAEQQRLRDSVERADQWDGIFLSWEDAVTEQERQYCALITEYKSAKCCGVIGPRRAPRSLVASARRPNVDGQSVITSFDVDNLDMSDAKNK